MRTNRAHWLLIPLLLLASCDATDPTPYPYMPQFVAPSEVPPRLLEIPPAPDSAEYRREIDGIIATQSKLTEQEKATIMAEDHIAPSMIVLPVIGPEYTEEKFPAMYNLLRHAASDAWRDADYAQDYWKRQRPWVVDERVQLLAKPITRPSYPSGHSTTNHVWAHVLTDLFPEKQAALFTRAHEIGMHRVAAGVHYPSDVEAGKRFASFIYDKMSKDAQYKTELAAAHAEVEAAIKAATPPIVVVHPDPNPLPPSMVPPVKPAVTEMPEAPAPVPSAVQPPLGTPYPGKSQLMNGTAPVEPPPEQAQPSTHENPAPVAPTAPPPPAPPAFKGNIPVNCMHPQPGELQTKCQ